MSKEIIEPSSERELMILMNEQIKAMSKESASINKKLDEIRESISEIEHKETVKKTQLNTDDIRLLKDDLTKLESAVKPIIDDYKKITKRLISIGITSLLIGGVMLKLIESLIK